jgi:anti-sigma B factor antagonist
MSATSYPTRWADRCAIITLPAEIDVTNAEEIRQALLTAVGRGPDILVIDMSATTFCDSAGVNAIISAHREAGANSTELRLVTTAVLRIFKLIGADQLMPIHPTLEAALEQAPSAG